MDEVRKKRGRPSHGLARVLYIRVRPDLVRQLDAVVKREVRDSPGRSISRADVAREILYAGVQERLGKQRKGLGI